MEFDNELVHDVDVDNNKLSKIKLRVIRLERDNFTTKKLKDNQVIDQIIKIIDMEAQNDN